MRDAPRVRGGLPVRLAFLFVGLAVMAAAIVSLLESGLGLAPWDVFHLGAARHSPLTIGTAGIAVGLVVLAGAWALGQAPGLGTVANAVVIGALVDVFRSFEWVKDLSGGGPSRVGLLLFGVAAFGVGSTLYIGAGLGAGPRDSLMLVLSRRTGARIAYVRTALESSAVVAGAALGGTFGIGTIVVAVLVGPVIEACFWLLYRSGLAIPVSADATPAVPGPFGPPDITA